MQGGQALTLAARARNSAGYLELLGAFDRANPAGHLNVIADNLSSHTSAPIQAWLAGRLRVHPMPLPVGACWLNLQEGWWRLLRKEALTGQSFADHSEIEQAVTGDTTRLNVARDSWW